jgi:hypothetical protein
VRDEAAAVACDEAGVLANADAAAAAIDEPTPDDSVMRRTFGPRRLCQRRELLDALSNPHAPFWAPWFNARAASPTLPVDPSGPSLSRLPPSRSVAHSLGRIFRVSSRSNIHSSDSNLPALEKDAALALEKDAALPALQQQQQQQQQQQGEGPQVPHQQSGLPPAPPGDGWAAMAGKAAAGDYSCDDGSPRTVVQRTFSLSNLFGLSW